MSKNGKHAPFSETVNPRKTNIFLQVCSDSTKDYDASSAGQLRFFHRSCFLQVDVQIFQILCFLVCSDFPKKIMLPGLLRFSKEDYASSAFNSCENKKH
jgi:hypothetical protein